MIDARRSGKEIGCRSDHAPVSLTMRFGCESSERKKKRAEDKIVIKWSELDDPSKEARHQAKLDELLNVIKDGEETLDSENVSDAIMRGGKATCKVKRAVDQGWFKMSAESLLKAIERRNLACTNDTDWMSTESKQELREAWKGARDAKKEAIGKWVRKMSQAMRMTIMAKNPKFTWKQVRVLEAGLTGHHKKPRTKRHVDKSGAEATNDKEDVENASNHFRKACNRDDAPVDFSVLDSVEQREMLLPELERPPGMDELIRAVKAMRGEAAPGESGGAGRCLKHCLADALESTLEALTKFWNGEQDNVQWHAASPTIIHKGKGKQGDLNSFRGVALQDMMAQIMSAMISRRLLDGPIAKCGIQAQFGSQPFVGCRDAICTIRSMLQMRR
jgi:hypothetical protein